MSDLPEAMGTAAEGGLFARAIDGEGSTVADQPTGQEGSCLNCGTEIIGAHCHGCGQKRQIHRSLKTILHDIVHGVLHLDGKFWRTLPLLAFRPGRLTRRYIDGERAKFISPMAMFLFSVFLMFAVFQVLGISTPGDLESGNVVVDGTELPDEDTAEALEVARGSLKALDENSPARAPLEATIEELETKLASEAEAVDGEQASGSGKDEEPGFSFSGTGIKAIDEGIVAKWNENPSLMAYKMQNNAYKFSWMLIPISVPLVWLMFFWKRRFKAYDHAIFVTYSLAFMSLLFLILSILGKLGVPLAILITAGTFIPPVHIYKQLKYGYELNRRQAFWRTVALVNMITFGVTFLFLWLLLMLGAL